jgi:predicted DNA-binding transcriptional regulator AlpA
MRDYQLLKNIGQLSDDVLVSVIEVAEITGLAPRTVQQRRLTDFPLPVPGIRRLRWRLGEVRAWMSRKSAVSLDGPSQAASRKKNRHGY